MRENMGLYRGKRIGSKSWVEGSLICWYDGSCSIETGNSLEPLYTVDPETVGECSGLPDKNGKLIFEGDIVKARFRNNRSAYKFEVTMADGMFLFDNHSVAVPSYDVYDLKVIGNIHDNPELRKGGTDE